MSIAQQAPVSLRESSRHESIRILYISVLFAPQRTAEAFCSAKFAKALLRSGADVTVMRYPGMTWEADESSEWQPLEEKVVKLPLASNKRSFQSLQMACRYRAPNYARWVGNVVREAAQLHRTRHFDLVYSRSLPMASHVAGYWCAKELNLPWIANVNDPWDLHLIPGAPLKVSWSEACLSSYWMKKSFRFADLITYPSERLRDYHVAVSGVKHESLVVPHVGRRSAARARVVLGGPEAKFNLVHAGKLGTNEILNRSTTALLQGLRAFLDDCPDARDITQLTLVGPSDAETERLARELQLDSVIHRVGSVDYEKSLEYVAAASVCVLVECQMDEGIYFPSKLVDYLSARRPVLALSPRVGVVADLAANGGITRVDNGDADAVRNALAVFYSSFRNGSLDRHAPPEELARAFSPEVTAQQFLDAASKLIQSRCHKETGSR